MEGARLHGWRYHIADAMQSLTENVTESKGSRPEFGTLQET